MYVPSIENEFWDRVVQRMSNLGTLMQHPGYASGSHIYEFTPDTEPQLVVCVEPHFGVVSVMPSEQ